MPKALSAPDDCGSGLQPLKLSTEPVMFGLSPNIQGLFFIRRWDQSGHIIVSAQNAFSYEDSGDSLVGVDSGSYEGNNQKLIFNANRSNSTFNGAKVQPSALQVLPCIKF